MRPFLVLAALATAGCLSLPGSLDDLATGLAPVLAIGESRVEGVEALVWEGKRLEGSSRRVDGEAVCGDANCERVPFRIDVPEDWWAENPGAVEVSIEWEHQSEDYATVDASWDAAPGLHNVPGFHYFGFPMLMMALSVEDASGRVVAEGSPAFHYASVAFLDNPEPGEYVAVVRALYGAGAYTGVVQVEPKAEREGELLPDLVMLAPGHLVIEHPIGREAPYPGDGTALNGCDPDETAEQDAFRCLRFASYFGNLGPGRLEMHLTVEEARRAVADEGTWVQWVYDAEGAHREEPASPAQFHKVHGHYHILGLDVTTLHAFDLETGTRGEAVTEGRKLGFCPVDSALIDPVGLGTMPPLLYDGCCAIWGHCQLFESDDGGYEVGLSPGWYDVYPWWRADQYVEITGVPDGVYELVTCANPDGYMVESRVDNNCASVLLQLTGDEVETLGEPPRPA